MSRIHLLSQDTINKIAAGEVVERPVSVIKELVENAIDANATAVTVEIKDGGLKLIRISDNGVGMNKDDIKNAFLRHATSKIEDASDLTSISSLGFRGEALASIAAVSMVECMSKTKEDITGIRYVVEGGIEKEIIDIGCPEGTTFVVRELFYNVPARKKFLKTAKTEGSYVTDLISRIALSHPGISFKYIINGNVRLHTSGNYSLIDSIYQVFGRDFAKNSKVVDYTNGTIKITGYVGEPILSRGNRQYEIYYVNGRYIKSKWIQKGIEDGTKEAMMINQFPFAVLFLEMPNDQLDVNVHPNKMQVRFDDEASIKENFRLSILEALHKRDSVMSVVLTEEEDKQLEKRIQKEEAKILKDAPEPFEISRLEKMLPHVSKHSFSKSPVSNNGVTNNKSSENNPILNNKGNINSPINIENVVSSLELTWSNDQGSEQKTVLEQTTEQDQAVMQDQATEQEQARVHDQSTVPSQEQARVHDQSTVPEQTIEQTIEQEQATMQNQALVKEQKSVQEQLQPETMDVFLDKQQIMKHKIIGQAFKTYWIVEYNNELYIIDQHAAHEKVLYEEWLKSIQTLEIPSQMLLEPLVYDLSDSEFDVFETFKDEIVQLGFDVEAFGGTTIIVKSVPYLLNMPLNDIDFIHFFDQLVSGEASIKREEQYLHKIASIACKAAIKGNNKLTEIEYHGLISRLLTLDDPYHCPHGRPTMIRMSKYELEKKFRRIV